MPGFGNNILEHGFFNLEFKNNKNKEFFKIRLASLLYLYVKDTFLNLYKDAHFSSSWDNKIEKINDIIFHKIKKYCYKIFSIKNDEFNKNNNILNFVYKENKYNDDYKFNIFIKPIDIINDSNSSFNISFYYFKENFYNFIYFPKLNDVFEDNFSIINKNIIDDSKIIKCIKIISAKCFQHNREILNYLYDKYEDDEDCQYKICSDCDTYNIHLVLHNQAKYYYNTNAKLFNILPSINLALKSNNTIVLINTKKYIKKYFDLNDVNNTNVVNLKIINTNEKIREKRWK